MAASSAQPLGAALRGALLLLATGGATAFYLPGVSPQEYDDGEQVDLKVNKLSSVLTHLPYEWYSLPFCRPDEIVDKAENLGEVMRGDKIMNSPYVVKMNVESVCNVLCRREYTNEIREFASKIGEDYRANWIVDNLPAATRIVEPAHGDTPSRIISIYERGFPLGFKGSKDIPGTEEGVTYLYAEITGGRASRRGGPMAAGALPGTTTTGSHSSTTWTRSSRARASSASRWSPSQSSTRTPASGPRRKKCSAPARARTPSRTNNRRSKPPRRAR